jgi:uncharacterized protein (TIGR02596 family)
MFIFRAMKPAQVCRHPAVAAFTLIETLVVVSIIVLILALTGPSLLGTMQASRLSSAGDTVLGLMAEAQQTAMAQNVPVEVRFFKYQTPTTSYEAYHSMQAFKVTNDPSVANGQIRELLVPIGTLTRLPDSVVIPLDKELAPLLDGKGFQDTKPDGSSTYSGVQAATYNAVRFMTDGTCRKLAENPATGVAAMSYPTLRTACITLTPEIGMQVTPTNLPNNFYCIQIDPFTGKMRTYRPGDY